MMAHPSWQIRGQYFETCSCDYVCPCVTTQMARSTHGDCTFAMAFQIARGSYGDLPLNDLSFVVIGHTPETMDRGNWSVGLIVDSRATAEQREAIAAIASGQAGGPLAGLAPLITTFLGVEAQPIEIRGSERRWSVSAGDLVDEGVEGTAGLGGQQLYLDGTGHPANDRLALARSTGSHVHAFGLSWDDSSGRNNGHFAPFAWEASAASG